MPYSEFAHLDLKKIQSGNQPLKKENINFKQHLAVQFFMRVNDNSLLIGRISLCALTFKIVLELCIRIILLINDAILGFIS